MSLKKIWSDFCEEEGSYEIPNVFNRAKFYSNSQLLNPNMLIAEASGDNTMRSSIGEVEAWNRIALVLVQENNKTNTIKGIQFLGKLIDARIGAALARMISTLNTLTELNLSNCLLNSEGFLLVEYILKNNPNIGVLYLDYNSEPLQKHYGAVRYGKLQHLSLKHCGIDGKGVQCITEYLLNNKTLKILDLSDNWIDDEGAIFISKVLRTNRTLVFLSLAGNRISTVGAKSIASSLKSFLLNREELCKRLKQMLEEVEQNKNYLTRKQAESSLPESSNLPPNQSHGNISDESRISKCSPSLDQLTSSFLNVASLPELGFDDEFNDIQLKKYNHPFLYDVEEHTHDVVCFGNYKLLCLNLSYNLINEEGAREFLKVLIYQDAYLLRGPAKGLAVLEMQGNEFEDTSEVLRIIDELLFYPTYLKDAKCSSKKKKINQKMLR